MGVLDEVTNKGREFSQKAKGMSDIASMNSSIHKLEKHLEELYACLGKQYFEEHRFDVGEGSYMEYREQIERIRKELERANQYVADLKNRNNMYVPKETKTCPNCGKILEAGAKFCMQCGADVKDVLTNDSYHAAIRRTEQPDASAMVKRTDQYVDIMDRKLKDLEKDLTNSNQ